MIQIWIESSPHHIKGRISIQSQETQICSFSYITNQASHYIKRELCPISVRSGFWLLSFYNNARPCYSWEASPIILHHFNRAACCNWKLFGPRELHAIYGMTVECWLIFKLSSSGLKQDALDRSNPSRTASKFSRSSCSRRGLRCLADELGEGSALSSVSWRNESQTITRTELGS